MNRMAMSTGGSALLRLLIARAGVPRTSVLLTDIKSVDWRSLTFSGERHELRLRMVGSDAADAAERLCCGIGECEISAPGVIVADISVTEREQLPDGSIVMAIQALTIEED